MRARSYPFILSLACGLAAAPAALAADTTSPTSVFVDIADPGVAEIRRLGERALDHAGSAMLVEVKHVLAESSPALAIGRLHLKDYPLPRAVPGQPAVVALRRTSLRVRNPANTPDTPDRAALELIRDQIENGDDVAPLLIQRVTLPGQPPEWRVYRPLVTLKQCLECHGSADELAPGVTDTLKVFFPTDRAVDYQVGKWRGLIRASIVEPAKKP
jgi:hypothetical protein